jgi:hypothetical protein
VVTWNRVLPYLKLQLRCLIHLIFVYICVSEENNTVLLLVLSVEHATKSNRLLVTQNATARKLSKVRLCIGMSFAKISTT